MSEPARRPLSAASLAALACGAALAAPFWVGRFVPLLDLPQHLAVVAVLRHHGDPAWGFDRFFDTQWGEFTPYWTFYLVTGALSLVLSIETAARVALSLYALAFPLAGLALARAFGRSPWLGLLAAPLAFSTNLYYGFISYCSGVLLMMWLLGAFERQLVAPRRARWLGLAIGGAVLFFTHVQVFAFFVALASVWGIVRAGVPWRRRLVQAAALLPATSGLFVPWCYRQFLAGRVGVAGEHDFGRLGRMRPSFRPVGESLLELPDAIAGAFQDGSDRGLFACWVALVALAGLRLRTRALILSGLALAAYFAAPLAITGQWNVGPRFAWTAALLLIPAMAAEGTRAARVGVLAAALTLLVAGNAARQHAAFDREVGPLDEALESIPRGSRVAPLMFDPRGAVLEQWPYLHIGQYAMVRRGGMTAFNLGRVAAFPIRLRDARSWPHTDVFRPRDFRFDVLGSHYDYFLLRGAGPSRDRLFRPGTVDPVFDRGGWTVLRRRFDSGGASDRIPVSSRTK
jgi:hypothetical protein